MRIIGGFLGGRRLEISPKLKARPTTDIAKEALFNILANRFEFEKLSVLDLFSGTGSISFEFYSRGATDITSIELNRFNNLYIKKNAEKLGIQNLKILQKDALSFLAKAKPNSFDIIFADPPFDYSHRFKIVDAVFSNHLLKANGLLIVEHEPKDNYELSPYFMELRQYGKVNFSFFHNP